VRGRGLDASSLIFTLLQFLVLLDLLLFSLYKFMQYSVIIPYMYTVCNDQIGGDNISISAFCGAKNMGFAHARKAPYQ
jgi:hypothetical protein